MLESIPLSKAESQDVRRFVRAAGIKCYDYVGLSGTDLPVVAPSLIEAIRELSNSSPVEMTAEPIPSSNPTDNNL